MHQIRCHDGRVLVGAADVTYAELIALADDPQRDDKTELIRVPVLHEDVILAFSWYSGAVPREPTFDEAVQIVQSPMVRGTRTPAAIPWVTRLRAALVETADLMPDDELVRKSRLPLATLVPEDPPPAGEPCLACGAACEAFETRVCNGCRAMQWTRLEQHQIRGTVHG